MRLLIACSKKDQLVRLHKFCEIVGLNHHVLVKDLNALQKEVSNFKRNGVIFFDEAFLEKAPASIERIFQYFRKSGNCLVFLANSHNENICEKLTQYDKQFFLDENASLPVFQTLLRQLSSISSEEELQQPAQSETAARNLLQVLVHDVSNLFANLDIYFSTIDRVLPEPIRKKRLKRAKNTVADLKQMLKNVRSLHAIRSHAPIVQVEKVEVLKLVKELKELYLDRLEEKGLDLIVDCDLRVTATVIVDKLALKHQILGNLLSNAIKFSHPNSIIEIDITQADSCVRIAIRDHGIGMSDEQAKKLFDKSPNSSRKGTLGESGSGYGIQLAQEFTEAFSGQISFVKPTAKSRYSGDVKGSCFVIELPIHNLKRNTA